MLRSRPQILRRPRPPVEGLFCGYSHRICMQNRLEGHDYCLKHILEDKNSPYKQCNYVSNKSGKRCPSAAPKADKKDGYCAEHARKALLLRQRASRKRRPRETPETLLEQIEHYGSKTNQTGRESKRSRANLDSAANRILDYASSSDSEVEPTLIEQAWRGDGDSDAESVDSEQEDPLKHAGIYTAEEVALITRDKLIRLQSLYIDQFKRLQHVMKEKRRKYLHASKMERETLASVSSAKDDPEQRDKYEKLVAMKRYHKRYGKEALLHRQSKERRIAVSEGPNYKPPAHPKCTYSSGTFKCSSRTVPLSKYCLEHILHDPQQVLYQPCGYGDGVCLRPLAALTETASCPYHTQLNEAKHRLAQEEKEEDLKDISIDVVSDSEMKMVSLIESEAVTSALVGAQDLVDMKTESTLNDQESTPSPSLTRPAAEVTTDSSSSTPQPLDGSTAPV